MYKVLSCMFHFILKLLAQAICLTGYFGRYCRARCVYPYNGEECEAECNCIEPLCDATIGCKAVDEGII